jgi:hypothetical protein
MRSTVCRAWKALPFQQNHLNRSSSAPASLARSVGGVSGNSGSAAGGRKDLAMLAPATRLFAPELIGC